MFSEYLSLNLMSRPSPVDIWRALELKIPIKIVSGRCAVVMSIQKYCWDCLLSMLGESWSSKLLSRASPVDVWKASEFKIAAKIVSRGCLKSSGAEHYCQNSPVDVWRVLDLNITVKIVSCRRLESVGTQNYCLGCLLSMFGRYINHKLLSILFPLEVW